MRRRCQSVQANQWHWLCQPIRKNEIKKASRSRENGVSVQKIDKKVWHDAAALPAGNEPTRQPMALAVPTHSEK
jgi:hypothetical protein